MTLRQRPVDSDPAAAETVAIVLAAGLSRRMGSPKLLLPLDGQRTVIEVVVEVLQRRVRRVLVVLGHRAAEVADRLAGMGPEVVDNPRFREGMLTSVQCGVEAAGPAAGYLICLGDQPGVTSETVAAILEAAARTGKGIVVPTYLGRRGHPVYVASRYRAEILGIGGPAGGLGVVTRGHPADALEVPVDSAAVLEDMDTPQQYQRELARRAEGRPR